MNESAIERPVNVWMSLLKDDEWWILFYFYKEVAYLCDYLLSVVRNDVKGYRATKPPKT